jgi:hypothetical protein
MKCTLIIIFYFISFLCFAEDFYSGGDANLFVKKFNEMKNKLPNGKFEYLLDEYSGATPGCSTCPPLLKLTNDVNQALQKLSENPVKKESDEDIELPTKIKKLKFLYYDVKMHLPDGSIVCKKHINFVDQSFNPEKYDFKGQMQLLGDQVFQFNDIRSVLLSDPTTQDVSYYYRGEGESKNLFVQAIMRKDGTSLFRYYRYYPTEKELNPYNLPDLTGEDENIYKKRRRPKVSSISQLADEDSSKVKNSNTIEFKADLEKSHGLPKDVHFMDASVDTKLSDQLNLVGESHLSLKGNIGKLKVNNGERDVVLLNVETKLNGETKHQIIIPYSVDLTNLYEGSKVNSTVVKDESGSAVVLSLTDHNIESVRAEIRNNSNTGRTSKIIAKDYIVSDKEVYGGAMGSDENGNRFISFKHARSFSKNASMVIDLRIGSDHTTTLMYQFSSRF